MLDAGTKRLSGGLKIFLDLVFLGGIFILLSLPYTLKWYFVHLGNESRENFYFLLVFLDFTGLFALAIVWELRKIFRTLTRMNPFMMDNVKSLRYMAVEAFIISIAYIVKILFYNTILTMIVSMIFVIAGLFSIILSEVFRQAVIYKEENDLTI